MNDQVTVSRELLRQAVDWFQCHKDNSMSRNNSEQLADEVESALRTALEQPMQEPVAWMTFDGEGGYELRLYEANESYRDDFIRRNGERYADWVTPLYAAPQAQPPAPVKEHWSDCATNNEPAYPAGDCDCTPTPAMCRAAVEFINGADVYKKMPREVLDIEESIYHGVWIAMQDAAPKSQQSRPLTDAMEQE